MRLLFPLCIACFISIQSIAQLNLPKQMPESFIKANPKLETSTQKKIFIFYTYSGQGLAEAMYNGVDYLTGNNNVIYIPVYVNSFVKQVNSLTFTNSIPIKTIGNFNNKDYAMFGLKETDIPLMIVYNEKNELCGYSQSVEGLMKIDCLNVAKPTK